MQLSGVDDSLRVLRQSLIDALNWWWSGISNTLPGWLIELFLRPLQRLVVTVDGAQLVVSLELDGQSTVLDTLEMAELADGGRFIIDQLAARQIKAGELATEYRLNPARLLKYTLTLPAQARNNLREAVAYQLNRLTPFDENAIFYDVVAMEVTAAGQLRADLYLVPKADIAVQLQQLQLLLGQPVRRLTTTEHGDRLNLLPQPVVRRRPNRNVAYAILGLFCIAVVVVTPVLKMRTQVVAQNEEITSLRDQVADLVEIRNELRNGIASLAYLVEQRELHPGPANLLEEVSRLVPDNAYVQDMQIFNDKLLLRGEGNEIVALVETLESSPMLRDVKLSSAVTRDVRRNVDRFTIEAQFAEDAP